MEKMNIIWGGGVILVCEPRWHVCLCAQKCPRLDDYITNGEKITEI